MTDRKPCMAAKELFMIVNRVGVKNAKYKKGVLVVK